MKQLPPLDRYTVWRRFAQKANAAKTAMRIDMHNAAQYAREGSYERVRSSIEAALANLDVAEANETAADKLADEMETTT